MWEFVACVLVVSAILGLRAYRARAASGGASRRTLGLPKDTGHDWTDRKSDEPRRGEPSRSRASEWFRAGLQDPTWVVRPQRSLDDSIVAEAIKSARVSGGILGAASVMRIQPEFIITGSAVEIMQVRAMADPTGVVVKSRVSALVLGKARRENTDFEIVFPEVFRFDYVVDEKANGFTVAEASNKSRVKFADRIETHYLRPDTSERLEHASDLIPTESPRAAAASGWVVEADGVGHVHDIGPSGIIVGRSPEAQLRVPQQLSPSASNKHLRISADRLGQHVVVTDLSTNGTWLLESDHWTRLQPNVPTRVSGQPILRLVECTECAFTLRLRQIQP